MSDPAERNKRRTGLSFPLFLCCLVFLGCKSSGRAPTTGGLKKANLSVYRITDNQPGHEFVKTGEFLVPVGSVILIKGLEFEPGVCTLTTQQRLIVQQIFNCLEEITENTPGDTNLPRVAEFKRMKFEIRGCSENSGDHDRNAALAEARAKAVFDFLTYLGTPSWRLKTTVCMDSQSVLNSVREHHRADGRVEFIRRQ
jgi:outer membrane protein OmpA-like peptidoglycan-associated protein